MSNVCARCVLLRYSRRFLFDANDITRNFLPLSSLFYSKRTLHLTSSSCRKVRIPVLNRTNVNLQRQKQIKYSEDFIQQKIEEYELGVRRLALMMGKDPNTFQQKDVDKAIRYLFPSDLFDKGSRPRMAHPSLVFPASQKIEADEDGRPHHYLYYTKHPEIHHAMTEAYWKILEVQHRYDQRLKRSKPPKPLNLDGTEWIDTTALNKLLNCSTPVNQEKYEKFIAQMERLAEEPCAGLCEDFVMKFRYKLPKPTSSADTAKIETDEIGRRFVWADGKRKTAVASVKLIADGSGKITINGQPMQERFVMMLDRETIITPFTFLKKLLEFDVEASVDGGFAGNWTMLHGRKNENDSRRMSSQAGAIRLAISKALLGFVTNEEAEQMRRAGLLTSDPRRRERKKPGQEGSRRKFTWKKR